MMLSWMQSSIRQPPGAHWERRTLLSVNHRKCFTGLTQERRSADPTNLFHPIIVEDVHIIPRSTGKPARKEKKIHSLFWFFFFTRWRTQQGDAQVLPALEECHIKNRRIGIHELQQEGFQDEALLEVGFSFGNFWKNERERVMKERGVRVRVRWTTRAEGQFQRLFVSFFWQINS